ncbi:MAG: photosynthetic complex assembly protein PuhC [Hyphomicrobiales bacterium]|jgi:putative photosynthetic complex assembly protein
MSAETHQGDPLKVPVMMIGALIVTVIAMVAMIRMERRADPASVEPPAAIVEELKLTVVDAADGSTTVSDAASGKVLATIEPEKESFFRSIRHVMDRERMRAGGGPEQLKLDLRADGALEFVDAASGFGLDVRGFGSSNSKFFSELLIRESTTP